VVKFNLIIPKNLAAKLALIVVAADDSKHDVTRNVPTDATLVMRFRERLVDEEDRAEVTEDRTGFIVVPIVGHLGIVVGVEGGDHLFKPFPAVGVVDTLGKNVFEALVVRHHFCARNLRKRELLD
jgi:hypothetical protein